MEISNKPFDWEIVEKPIHSNNKTLSGYKAIFRDDTGGLLNVAKESYTPTPNTRFIDTVQRMSEITGFPVKCYEEFENGKKVLAFLECTEPIQVQGYDFKDYMMIGNSHDSSTGFFIGNSSQMIRCANRFSTVFRQLKVNHTRNHDVKIDLLMNQFESFMNERRQLFEKMERFAGVQIDPSLKRALAERLARVSEEEKLGAKELSTRKENIVSGILHSVELECTDLGDNLFGLFNGATHYTTHVKRAKETTFGNALGSLARMNAEALGFCEAQLFI